MSDPYKIGQITSSRNANVKIEVGTYNNHVKIDAEDKYDHVPAFISVNEAKELINNLHKAINHIEGGR